MIDLHERGRSCADKVLAIICLVIGRFTAVLDYRTYSLAHQFSHCHGMLIKSFAKCAKCVKAQENGRNWIISTCFIFLNSDTTFKLPWDTNAAQWRPTLRVYDIYGAPLSRRRNQKHFTKAWVEYASKSVQCCHTEGSIPLCKTYAIDDVFFKKDLNMSNFFTVK